MNFKRALTASTLAAGIGVAGLFGVGLAGANADPGGPCPPNAPCGQRDDHRGAGGPGAAAPDWHNRGIDQGRQDHQPFDWNGQQVNPVFDDGHQAWGFWLGPVWIPL